MSKRLVCFCHTVSFFLLLEGAAHAVLGVHDLARQSLSHGSLGTVSGIVDQPTESQSLLALRADLHRHLVGGTTHAASLNLQLGLDVVKRGLENGTIIPEEGGKA